MADDELEAALSKAEAVPSSQSFVGRTVDRLGSGLARVGSAVAGGLGAAADVAGSLGHSLDDPSHRREILRGIDNMVTLGYGQKLADYIGTKLGDKPDVQLGATAAGDQQVAPGYRALGSGIGMALPGAAGLAAGLGAKAAGLGAGAGMAGAGLGARVATGAARGALGYEATAPALAGLSADAAGHRMSSAADVATDPAGLLMSGGAGAATGAAQKVIETAPTRVAARQAKDITTGETNARAKVTRAVQSKVGEGGDNLDELLSRDPQLSKLVATKAGTSPAKVAAAVADKQAAIGGELDRMYGQMQKSGHTVDPTDIANEFDKMLLRYKQQGDLPAISAVSRARADFLNTYGSSGVNQAMSADQLRGLKASAGKAAFPDMGADPTTKAKVQRDIWGAFSAAIERKAAAAPGVDVDKLRQLNSDMSILIPVHNALAERATAAAAGRPSMHEMFGHAAGMAVGSSLGAHEFGPAGLALGLAAPVAAKLGAQGVRLGDYNLAQRFGGVAPEVGAKAGARAGELEFAAKVSDNMKQGMSLEDALKAAGE